MTVPPDFAERLAAFASDDFGEPRPGQKLVLDAYSAGHLDTADLAIEMLTGDGKTLLALLIADWALDRGWSVAYVTGTRQLAEHVESEAARLGLVRFAGRDYGGAKLDDCHQARAVGTMERPRIGLCGDILLLPKQNVASSFRLWEHALDDQPS